MESTDRVDRRLEHLFLLAATTTRVAVHQPCMAHNLHGLSWATLI
eukprot:COSAG05_NODE_2918_length_2511_cov_2.004146_1_plen_44_part_10